jgi:hypothetical protein
MEKRMHFQLSAYEQAVIGIIRKLPPENIVQLVNFARFLEFQTTKEYKDWLEEEEIETAEAKWDELLAKPEAKRVMRELAREAREDYRAGRTTDIEITEDGRLGPA